MLFSDELSQPAADLERAVLDSQNRTRLVGVSPQEGREGLGVIGSLRLDVEEEVEQRDLVQVDAAHQLELDLKEAEKANFKNSLNSSLFKLQSYEKYKKLCSQAR